MTSPNSLPVEKWDPFFQKVQRTLVEPLGLNNVEIYVDRHDGKNANVTVEHSHSKTSPSKPAEPVVSQKKLTIDQLTAEIELILDQLLKGCAIQFGDIRFVVDCGQLTVTVFSVSARPHESSQGFFVNI